MDGGATSVLLGLGTTLIAAGWMLLARKGRRFR
jgi:hypothetical protein